MTAKSFGVFFLVFQLLMAAGWADDIKEADYPVHYEVLSGSKTDKLVLQKVCSMTLRDQAHANIIISVSRKRIDSCQALPSGSVYNGRENAKKDVIVLIIPVGESRARLESWHIDGTVKIPQ